MCLRVDSRHSLTITFVKEERNDHSTYRGRRLAMRLHERADTLHTWTTLLAVTGSVVLQRLCIERKLWADFRDIWGMGRPWIRKQLIKFQVIVG